MSRKPDAITVATREVTHTGWHRSSVSYLSGEPPHTRYHDFDREHSLSMVWADPDQRVPVAANDLDGCYAVIEPAR